MSKREQLIDLLDERLLIEDAILREELRYQDISLSIYELNQQLEKVEKELVILEQGKDKNIENTEEIWKNP